MAQVNQPIGGYFCPYCAVQGPVDSWFTKEQIELAQNTVMRQSVDPILDTFGRDLRRSSRGGFVKFDMQCG
jgi:hypothetical protein